VLKYENGLPNGTHEDIVEIFKYKDSIFIRKVICKMSQIFIFSDLNNYFAVCRYGMVIK
jgi:hypothetical protein